MIRFREWLSSLSFKDSHKKTTTNSNKKQ